VAGSQSLANPRPSAFTPFYASILVSLESPSALRPREGDAEEGRANQSSMAFDAVVDYIVDQIVDGHDHGHDHDHVHYHP